MVELEWTWRGKSFCLNGSMYVTIKAIFIEDFESAQVHENIGLIILRLKSMSIRRMWTT